jgi:hypothetical protein
MSENIDYLERHVTRQMAIFVVRSFELADRVAIGELELIDGVDMAIEAARWSGLAASIGDDTVQEILHEAFAGVQR